MQKHPIIISAPHTCGTIPTKFKNRIALSDFEIWQMHDPFTDETCFYPEAFAIHKSKNHRILGDLNRDKNASDIFRKRDFYDRKVWKDKKQLTKEEQKEFMEKYWKPYREAIKESFIKLSKKGVKKIFFLDHHNTATDHPANKGRYLPPITIGNFGDKSGNQTEIPITSSPEVINAFQQALEQEIPEITVAMNTVYKGSSLIKFVQEKIKPALPDCEIHAIILEYDLNLIFNPLSKETDKVAQQKLHQGINQAIRTLIETHFI